MISSSLFVHLASSYAAPKQFCKITLMTASGQAKAKLSEADKVVLGKLAATNVPAAIRNGDDKSYGAGVDGLLGMSFLSRFEVQMAGGPIEVRTRQPKK
ncbi:retropepsin-like aspartic protease family protein [Bradyrhizobium genosp. P]|uniref:retropepsin-like aspartic protease family protein n=1 Tax=Bradyrhizobium genosp. P TaxID=83641 RepID=UPI003CEE55C2